MDSIKTALFQKLMHDKNYAEISRLSGMIHNESIVITEYAGSEPRLFKRDGKTHLLCPKDIDTVMESGVARAIETGEIFDDADAVDRHADFIQRTMLPLNAMGNSNVEEPKKMKIVIASVIGRMNPDGHVELSESDMERGSDVVKDIMHHHHHNDFGGHHVGDICAKHIGCGDHMHMPIDIRRDMFSLSKEIDSIADVDDLEENELEPSDIDFDDIKDKDEGMEEPRDNSVDDDDDDIDENNDDKDDDEDDESKSSEPDDDKNDNEEHVQESAKTTKRRLKSAFVLALITGGLSVLGLQHITLIELLCVVGMTTPAAYAMQNLFRSKREAEKISMEVLRLISRISRILLSDIDNERDERKATLKLKTYVGNLATECMYLDHQLKKRDDAKCVRNLMLRCESISRKLKSGLHSIDKKELESFLEAMKDVSEMLTGKPLDYIADKKTVNEYLSREVYCAKVVQEGVTLLKQPRRLKAIGREIVNYIPSQIMQVQDTHDQMVLVGYVSSQLEKVDFYLNCLDTDDGRYIVPHDKNYLLALQKELTDLLQRIMRLNPIVKYDRIWKPGIR